MSDLTVVEQQEIIFYEDALTAVKAANGSIYAVISHMCDALGIDVEGQVRRVQRHSVLARGFTWADILSGQQSRRVRMLRADLVPLWLSGLRTSMVKDEIRPKLERFQDEAAKVLWEAFQDGRLSVNNPPLEELLATDSPAAESYKMLRAMLRLAHNQLLIEARQETQQAQLTDHEQRLESLETAVSRPNRTISEEQAAQLSQAVKAVAIAQGKISKRNEFGAVYGELYRKYGINSYKLLPLSRFDEAMAFLNEWLASMTGQEPF